jgi:hypothetical protein
MVSYNRLISNNIQENAIFFILFNHYPSLILKIDEIIGNK